MEFIEASNPEWLEMWTELSTHTLNNGDPICEFMGKSWEYMGSTEDHHHLRHLRHPYTGKEEFVYIERKRASIKWARIA